MRAKCQLFIFTFCFVVFNALFYFCFILFCEFAHVFLKIYCRICCLFDFLHLWQTVYMFYFLVCLFCFYYYWLGNVVALSDSFSIICLNFTLWCVVCCKHCFLYVALYLWFEILFFEIDSRWLIVFGIMGERCIQLSLLILFFLFVSRVQLCFVMWCSFHTFFFFVHHCFCYSMTLGIVLVFVMHRPVPLSFFLMFCGCMFFSLFGLNWMFFLCFVFDFFPTVEIVG